MNPNDPVRVYREARANAGTSSLLDVDPDTLHLWRRARSLEAVSRVNPRVPESWSEEYRGIRSALRAHDRSVLLPAAHKSRSNGPRNCGIFYGI